MSLICAGVTFLSYLNIFPFTKFHLAETSNINYKYFTVVPLYTFKNQFIVLSSASHLDLHIQFLYNNVRLET